MVANSSKVKISFLFTSINVSKIWLILLCFVLGLVSGVLISQVHRHRKNERADWSSRPSSRRSAVAQSTGDGMLKRS